LGLVYTGKRIKSEVDDAASRARAKGALGMN